MNLAPAPGVAPAALAEPRLEELELPAELAPWQVEANAYELLEGEQAGDGLAGRRIELRGRAPKRILIPGRFEVDSVNRVLLQAEVFGSTNFSAALVRGDRAVLASSTISLAFSRDPQTVVLDLPHARTLGEPCDALAIDVHGPGFTRVGKVSIVRQDVESWLPRATDPPALIPIGAESRRARALTSERPWTVRARPTRGSILSFSYGVPHHLHHPSAEPVLLRVSVARGGREEAFETFALDDPPAQPRWRTGRVPLGAYAGKDVELRFELALPGASPAVALCAVGEVRLLEPREGARTVLLVTSDTHRADYLGRSDRGVHVETPNLDALADRGAWFEDCFSTTNVTNPSHIALMTATHPRDTGIFDNKTPLADLAPTLAERFHEAGFVTFAAVSTRHLGHDVSGLGQGFDRMSWPPGGGERSAGETLDVVERWLGDVEGAPLFLWVHAFDAHTPYAPPEEYGRIYYDPGKDPFDPALPESGVDDGMLPSFLRGLRDLEYPEAMYRGEISYLDRELARLLSAPRFAEGVVAFTSDHGENLGHHGIYFDHADLYPDTIHIPLILAWPGGPRGLRVREPVEQIDVGRTLLDLAGLAGADFPGRSLAAELEREAEDAPRFAAASNFASASMTWRGWHLILHLRRHAERNREVPAEKHQVELYDLRADPACERDLVRDEHGRAKAMRQALIHWILDARDLGWALESRQDSALLAQLAQLGYVDDGPSGRTSELIDPECDCAWCQPFR